MQNFQTMTKYKIAIVDDEVLFIEGMKLILGQNEQLEITNTAQNGAELLELIKTKQFNADVIMLDLSMPVLDGVDTLLALNEMKHPAKVIILSSHYNDSIIVKLLDEGAAGFLAKNENPDEVIKTIIKVAKKGFYINDYILQLIRNRRLLASRKKLHSNLSKREVEILILICEENTNKEIAEKLFISPRTVEGHRNRILDKTNSKNTAGLVIFAIENNLIDINISRFT